MWMLMPYLVQATEWARRPFRREGGQGLVEYALILVLVAVVVIAALTLLSGSIDTVFRGVQSTLEAGAGS